MSRARALALPAPTPSQQSGPVAGRHVKLYCPRLLRKRWPLPLATIWHAAYPRVLSKEDLRYTLHFTQSGSGNNYHFVEWFAAIHLFHLTGMNVLVKRYTFSDHLWKRQVIRDRLGEDGLAFLVNKLEGQPPDLFLYTSDRSDCYFAEVKGQGDRLRPSQKRNHALIEKHLGRRVDVIEVRYDSGTRFSRPARSRW